MGLFDHLTIADDIDLPEWEYDDDPGWQTKDIERPAMYHYRITSDGRLEKRQDIYREKTDEEKQQEAKKWGFDSWDEYVETYDEFVEEGEYNHTVPEAVDWDEDAIKAPREFETHEYWSFEAMFTKGDLDSIECNYINDLNED